MSRGPASNLMPQESAPSKTRISHTSRKNQENQRNKFQAKKLTEVAGRISSSNAWRAHSNPRYRVLRAVTSSSSSASSPDSKAAAHVV
jgi:hypothetical protein